MDGWMGGGMGVLTYIKARKTGFKHQFMSMLGSGFHGRRTCEQGSKSLREECVRK